MSPLSPESRRKPNPRQGKNSLTSNICQVCGDSASIYNYGALSCQSCKTFFRRNTSHPYLKNVRPCFFNKTCQVDLRTRRICTACRLDKCLSVGMSPDLIRKALSKHDKSASTNPPEKEMLSALPVMTLDLIRADRSNLASSEWTLISNIVHAHDRFSGIPIVREQVDRAARNTIVYDVNNVLETVLLMYTSTKSFVTSTPDFRILTSTEQSSLLDRNFHGIMALVSIIFMRVGGIFETAPCLNVFNTVYGTRMVVHAQRIERELDIDLTILKVLLLILTFSSNCFAFDVQTTTGKDSFLHGTYRLFGSQSVYVELLWKFMIYRYGYQDTVLRFTKIILLFLDIMKHCGEIHTTNDVHNHLVEGAVDQMKHSLIIEKTDSEPLWGKT